MRLALNSLLPPKSAMKPLALRAVAQTFLNAGGLTSFLGLPVFVASAHAQLLEVPFGGLKQAGSVIQALEFSKAVAASVVSSGSDVTVEGTAALVLTKDPVTVEASSILPGSYSLTRITTIGFGGDSLTNLGTGAITAQASNLVGQQLDQNGQTPSGSSVAQFILNRSAISNNSSFVNSFASQFR